MRVSYLTDAQVREAYLLLLTRIEEHMWMCSLDKIKYWEELGYERDEIPEY
jgi:hypothetical protein